MRHAVFCVYLACCSNAGVGSVTDLTVYNQTLRLSGSVSETESRVRAVVGATVNIENAGAPHYAFPSAARANGVIRTLYRHGAAHGPELTGEQLWRERAVSGGAWSGAQTAISEPGVNDNHNGFISYDFARNLWVMTWDRNIVTAVQCYDRPLAGGDEVNLIGVDTWLGDGRLSSAPRPS